MFEWDTFILSVDFMDVIIADIPIIRVVGPYIPSVDFMYFYRIQVRIPQDKIPQDIMPTDKIPHDNIPQDIIPQSDKIPQSHLLIILLMNNEQMYVRDDM